ncbi:MAG: RDD family protein [Myxococcota bacterium]
MEPSWPGLALTPAPLGRRVLAGVFDACAVAVLSICCFLVPMVLRGLVLPMWGVLAALVGYQVVPLAFLKQTLGMRLFGLELVRRDGHHVDLANLLFRELIGRGFFPAAYLFTLLAGATAAALGVAATATPVLLGGLMALASMGALAMAVVGHLLALGRPDGRTLADLFASSYVALGPTRAPPDDEEERAEWDAHRARVKRNIVVFEVLLVASVLAIPWVLSSRGGETAKERGARIAREALEKKFAADPGNEALAAELERAWWQAGRDDEVRRVEQAHQTALKKREGEREALLRERFATTKDRANASALVELLERQGRVDDAEVVYRQYVEADGRPSTRAGFGHWLASVGRPGDAVNQLEVALREDPLVPYGHTLLGVSLVRAGRAEEGRAQLLLALADDPNDEDARDALADLEQTIGPSTEQMKALAAASVRAWRLDAGVEAK